MDAIKSYLEAMFANLPNTEAVRKAKKELAQMMEDKYNELIAGGSTENEAVGAVISGFGNLDDLAEELGLTEEIKEEKEQAINRRRVSFDEAGDYVADKSRFGFLLGIGIMCTIISIASMIIAEEVLSLPDGLCIGSMFILIFLGVGLIIYSSLSMGKWKFLEKVPCIIDLETTTAVAQAKEQFQKTRIGLLTLGIILCATCWLPAAMLDGATKYISHVDDLSGALLFVMVGVGVFFIVYSSIANSAYDRLLKLNDTKTVAGAYAAAVEEKETEDKYVSETGRLVMSIYWPTITCIYLVYSFTTFNWATSWIIWIAASIGHTVLKSIFVKKK